MLCVGPERLISLRYIMKNARQEVLVDNMEQNSVHFVYGSGDILPALERPLMGLKIGERKTFTVLPEDPGFDEIFHFDVIIDDIRLPTDERQKEASSPTDDCGPDCDC